MSTILMGGYYNKTVTNATSFIVNDLTVTGEAIFEEGIKTGDSDATFTYKKGMWTPTFRWITSAGVQVPTGVVDYTKQFGSFVKIGSEVTVSFDLEFGFSSGDDGRGPDNDKFVVIGGLPFKCNNRDAPEDFVSSSETLTSSSFPNGIAFDLVPIIAEPTYPGPYTVSSYEEGFPVPLYVNVIVSFDDGEWISDGYHLVLSSQCDLYGVTIGVPPWNVIQSSTTPLSNFHVSGLLPTYYPGCRFAGSITYYTDE